MSLAPRLDLRQTQSLVMTPQLQQAIKLLALSNLELEAHIGAALEANPLLEIGEVSREGGEELAPVGDRDTTPLMDSAGGDEAPLDIEPSALDPESGPGDANFDADWGRAADSPGSGGELPDLENRGEAGPTLAEHLLAQIGAPVAPWIAYAARAAPSPQIGPARPTRARSRTLTIGCRDLMTAPMPGMNIGADAAMPKRRNAATCPISCT